MPKNIEDIVPSNRRSIRDIPIPVSRRRAPHKEEKEPESIPEPIIPRLAPHREHRRKGKKGLWISITVGVVVLVFAGMAFFQSATLAYVPKSADLSFNGENFSARKTGDGALLFSVVKISGSKGAPVAATGEEPVSIKASGTIVIYNKTTAAQPLVATTRFQTTDGKIYRIDKGVNVPAGSATQPGSVEATVYADQAGPDYNAGLTDFTLPGLKGTPKYSTIYARSKTPISGGANGTQKKVSADLLASTKATLQAGLKQDLITQAQSQVPADFILFPALSTIAYADLPQTNQTGDSVTINQKGDFYGVMFKKSDLAKYLAAKKTTLGSNDQVEITSYDNLVLSFAGGAPADLLNTEAINFNVTGPAQLLWVTDEAGLKASLAGHGKKDLPSILADYPSIESANAVLRPFWKTSFPADSTKITIKEKSV